MNEATVETNNHDALRDETPAQPKLSRMQIGKMRRQYLTIVHDTVDACGHKFNRSKQPTNNCPDCWYAYFKLSANMDELHTQLTISVSNVVKQHGTVFLKQFRRFLNVELAALHNALPTEDVPEGIAPGGLDGIPEEAGSTEGTEVSN